MFIVVFLIPLRFKLVKLVEDYRYSCFDFFPTSLYSPLPLSFPKDSSISLISLFFKKITFVCHHRLDYISKVYVKGVIKCSLFCFLSSIQFNHIKIHPYCNVYQHVIFFIAKKYSIVWYSTISSPFLFLNHIRMRQFLDIPNKTAMNIQI